MGEEPWRVHNVGALSVDNLRDIELIEKDRFLDQFSLSEEFILVTFHPVTLEIEQVEFQIENLIEALSSWGGDVLFTMPNADPGSMIIRGQVALNVENHENWTSVENLGTQGYYSAMKYASAMLGNSSSGIIESGLFGLPVVNIGTRQTGRIRGPNIIDVGYNQDQILNGISKALSIKGAQTRSFSIYGDGNTASAIIGILKSTEIDKKLITKIFVDL
jgi:UDP-hydrolysing UDP-N-acetyl-D-glucosamine 2-epimerase